MIATATAVPITKDRRYNGILLTKGRVSKPPIGAESVTPNIGINAPVTPAPIHNAGRIFSPDVTKKKHFWYTFWTCFARKGFTYYNHEN